MHNDFRSLFADAQEGPLQGSACEKVISYIKNKIVYKELRAGDKLPPEPELCATINVSRTAVREAIKILEGNNIVRVRRGDGTYISYADAIPFIDSMLFRALLRDTSSAELDEYRSALEFEIMRLAIAKADAADISLLEQSCEAMGRYVEESPENFAALHEADMGFHLLLADIARNSLLRDSYLTVMGIYSPLILRNYQAGQPGNTGYTIHKLLLNAVRNRDINAAICAVGMSTDLCSDWVEAHDPKEKGQNM